MWTGRTIKSHDEEKARALDKSHNACFPIYQSTTHFKIPPQLPANNFKKVRTGKAIESNETTALSVSTIHDGPRTKWRKRTEDSTMLPLRREV